MRWWYKLLELLKRKLRTKPRREPEAPQDPFADVLVPVGTGPKLRSGAVALPEPDEDE
ncbi:MAG: hypothetical protein ACRD24_07550 [Terriglobales bacterium]